jgi:hypothetical protein
LVRKISRLGPTVRARSDCNANQGNAPCHSREDVIWCRYDALRPFLSQGGGCVVDVSPCREWGGKTSLTVVIMGQLYTCGGRSRRGGVNEPHSDKGGTSSRPMVARLVRYGPVRQKTTFPCCDAHYQGDKDALTRRSGDRAGYVGRLKKAVSQPSFTANFYNSTHKTLDRRTYVSLYNSTPQSPDAVSHSERP